MGCECIICLQYIQLLCDFKGSNRSTPPSTLDIEHKPLHRRQWLKLLYQWTVTHEMNLAIYNYYTSGWQLNSTTPVSFRLKHIHFDAFRSSVHTNTLSVFTENVVESEYKWKRIRIVLVHADTRKRMLQLVEKYTFNTRLLYAILLGYLCIILWNYQYLMRSGEWIMASIMWFRIRLLSSLDITNGVSPATQFLSSLSRQHWLIIFFK